jgi:hypothetical protein
MWVKKNVFSIIYFFSVSCNAQINFQNSSSIWLSHVSQSPNHFEPISISVNQAILSKAKLPSLSIYSEKNFLIHDFTKMLCISIIPTKFGNVGLLFSRQGLNDYFLQNEGIILSKSLNEKSDIGIQFNCFQSQVKGGRIKSFVSADMSLSIQLSNRVNTAIQLRNLNSLIKISNNSIPYLYRFGLGYDISNEIFTSIDFCKSQFNNAFFTAGILYTLNEKYFLRYGFNSGSLCSNVGIGFKKNKIKIECSIMFHQILGSSPGILISENLKQQNLKQKK